MVTLLKAGAGKSATTANSAQIADTYRRPSAPNPHLAKLTAKRLDEANSYLRRAADDPGDSSVIGWAVYADRATRWLYPEDQPRQRAAGRRLGELVRARGRGGADFASVPDDTSTPAARLTRRFAIARLLHGTGLCDPAVREAHGALFHWMPHHEQAPGLGGTCLIDTVTMLEQCLRPRDGNTTLIGFSALLPDLRPDAYGLLISHARQRLGQPKDIDNHQQICGAQPEPATNRHHIGTLLEAFLEQLHDDNPDHPVP